MNRKAIFLSSGRLTLVSLLAVVIAGSAFADTTPITFKFNPPDGTSYIERTKEAQTVALSFGFKLNTCVTSMAKVDIRKTGSGYIYQSKPIAVDATMNGAPINSESAVTGNLLARKAALTTKIDTQGRILSIDGFDAYFAELSKIVQAKSPKEAAMLPALIPSLRQGAEAKVKEEWANRVGDFAGKTMTVGELWKSQEKAPAYSGSITVNQRTRLVQEEIHDGHRCVRLRFYYEADPKTVKSELKSAIHDAIESAGMTGDVQAPTISSIELTGSGERVIDPETMLIYADTETTTARLTMSVPGKGQMSLSEDGLKECSFDYKDLTAAAGSAITQATLAPNTKDQDISAMATDMVDHLSKGEYAAVVKRFDPTMTAALPEDRLRGSWEAVSGSAGPFQKQTGVRTSSQGTYNIVIVTCRFERAAIEAQFAFNKDKQVSGLYFRPAQQ